MSVCLCCEASHAFGMGHLYRMLNLGQVLRERGEELVFVVNPDGAAAGVLHSQGVAFHQQDFAAPAGWEVQVIRENDIHIWINDRLQTRQGHAQSVVSCGVRLVTLDDIGDGAASADLNIAALPAIYDQNLLQGKKILKGVSWLILHPRLQQLRRQRVKLAKRAVCLGGSDTHGATVRVADFLRQRSVEATYFVGPAFQHLGELAKIIPSGRIRQAVPSLLDELAAFDLAITGGGMIAFEAAAMGLPTITIANEKYEESNARLLERLGCSSYAGYHQELKSEAIGLIPDIQAMSRAGLENIAMDGVRKIAEEVGRL